MALHNYIYSKHPRDEQTDNRIARKHDSRPVIIKGNSITEDNLNHHNHEHHQKGDDIITEIDDDFLKAQIDDSWNSDHEMEDTESSDEISNKELLHDSKKIKHTSHHTHNHHTNNETKCDDLKNNNQHKEDTHKNILETNTDSQQPKWVIVNGRRRRLRSRFSNTNSNLNSK